MHQKKVKGTGFIRAVLCQSCNIFLGKIENNCTRYGVNITDLPIILKNMAEHIHNYTNIIHPTEVPKRKKLGKREWNKIKKFYFQAFPNRNVLPNKPIYITTGLIEMVNKINDYLISKGIDPIKL
jgi:hypothetical protein